MQIFPCPFCGDRDEREFSYLGENGKTRPDTTTPISDADWASYLHFKRNTQGLVAEIWMHLACSEVFLMERNSQTMDVMQATALRKDAS